MSKTLSSTSTGQKIMQGHGVLSMHIGRPFPNMILAMGYIARTLRKISAMDVSAPRNKLCEDLFSFSSVLRDTRCQKGNA